MNELRIVDAHFHLWNLDDGQLSYPWLQQASHEPFFLGDITDIQHSYLPVDYRRDAANHKVVQTVHIEAECAPGLAQAETDWLAGLQATHGMPDAIVAHACLHADDLEAALARQAAEPLVRGIRARPVVRAAPNGRLPGEAGSLQDPAWQAGLRRLQQYKLSCDLRLPAWHLAEAAEVLAGIPDTPVAINHMGLPWDRTESGLQRWRAGIAALAALPHCFCKLTCLCIPDGPWDYESNRALVLETIDLFGPQRCMFGSDFPVDRLRVNMDTLWRDYKRMTDDFSPAERELLFQGTATRFYRL